MWGESLSGSIAESLARVLGEDPEALDPEALEAFECLHEEDRRFWELYHVHGWTFERIAEGGDLRCDGIRQRMYAVRKWLVRVTPIRSYLRSVALPTPAKWGDVWDAWLWHHRSLIELTRAGVGGRSRLPQKRREASISVVSQCEDERARDLIVQIGKQSFGWQRPQPHRGMRRGVV